MIDCECVAQGQDCHIASGVFCWYRILIAAVRDALTTATLTYDTLGRLLTETTPIDANNNAIKKYYYDSNGNITSDRHKNNAVGSTETWARTDYGYNSRGFLAHVTQYDGTNIDNVTRYTYDGVGNMRTMRTGASTTLSSDGQVTEYTYDRYGNVLTITDALAQIESYEYSDTGKPKKKTDRNGNPTHYGYDGMGRISYSWVIPPSGGHVAIYYLYYLTGAVLQEATSIEGIGSATYLAYTYDTLGRATRISEGGVGIGGVVKQYGYDLADNVTSFKVNAINNTQRMNTTYEYDRLNRLEYVYENGNQVARYHYDANGNRSYLQYANGTDMYYTYNKANWVTRVSELSGDRFSYAYSYYADGNQRTKTDDMNKVTTYVYDGAGRLKSESETGGLNVAYEYDRNSNRTKMTVTGTENYVTNYAYDANNRLLTETKTAGGVDDITRYRYDPNGNQLSKTKERLASGSNSAGFSLIPGLALSEINRYNGFNQLIETRSGGVTASYSYYPNGLRATKTVNGVETAFVLNGGNVALEVTGGAVTAKYVRGINLINSTIGGAANWYFYNAHGDVVQLANNSGNVTKTYDYDAFGVEKNPDPNDANNFRYAGEYFDKETGTYYLRARYYDPGIGRFTAEDPAGAGLNWYTYGSNNPVMFIDPSGLFDEVALSRLLRLQLTWTPQNGAKIHAEANAIRDRLQVNAQYLESWAPNSEIHRLLNIILSDQSYTGGNSLAITEQAIDATRSYWKDYHNRKQNEAVRDVLVFSGVGAVGIKVGATAAAAAGTVTAVGNVISTAAPKVVPTIKKIAYNFNPRGTVNEAVNIVKRIIPSKPSTPQTEHDSDCW